MCAMRAAGLREVDVGLQSGVPGADRRVSFELDIFVLDVLPKRFNGYVIESASAAVLADGNPMAA